MPQKLSTVLVLLLAVLLATPVLAGDRAQVRLADGSRWRGEMSDQVKVTFVQRGTEIEMVGELKKVDDLYIVVDGKLAGLDAEKLIFIADIRSMSTVVAGVDEAKEDSSRASSRHDSSEATDEEIPRDRDGNPVGVFVLPLEGGVGQEFRHDEIKMLGEYVDQYGPGQIIVLIIDSNGGLVFESNRINEAIFEIRKRHRVIAWIKKAISAGCSTAMACNEIYFMTEGTAGSVTTVMGQQSVPEEQVREAIEEFAEMAERSGYSEHIARAMKLNRHMVSYDKDPDTGVVTFYPDLSGEFILSDGSQNLCFNASNALHCGFSKGTADTKEDLARMLDLPRWYEISDYGREIAKKWQRTYKRAETEIPRLIARLNYASTGSGDAQEIIGKRIQILQELVRWYDRAELVAMMQLPPREQLEREIEELQKQLSDMRNR